MSILEDNTLTYDNTSVTICRYIFTYDSTTIIVYLCMIIQGVSYGNILRAAMTHDTTAVLSYVFYNTFATAVTGVDVLVS